MKKDTLHQVLRFTKGFITDKNRKGLRKLIHDYRYLSANGGLLTNLKIYIRSLMYKKDAGQFNQYILGKMYAKIIKFYNDNLGMDPILENKLAFRELMKEQDLPHPAYLGKIESGILFTESERQISLTHEDEAANYITKSLEKHRQIFIKPTNTYGGKGILKYELGQPINLSTLRDSQHKYIIEKGIVHHEALSQINPYCITTLRVTTLNLKGKINIATAFLRMGVDKSPVDNLSAGGMFINYNFHQNKLSKTAYRPAIYGGRSFLKHPDTGFVFENKPLPFWNSIKDTILKAARLFPNIDMVGWDVAIASTGPLLIEGNSNPSLLRNQVILKGLKNNQLFIDYLNGRFDGVYSNFRKSKKTYRA